MRVERRGVFETNSSSTHSICIADKAGVRDTLPVIDGVCFIYPGEYGWEQEIYHDAATKASYMMTHVKTGCGRFAEDAPERAQREAMLAEVVAEETGADRVEFVSNPGDEYHKWGYIDHQSIAADGGAGEPAWESKEKLRAFIFDKASYLETDNDNH